MDQIMMQAGFGCLILLMSAALTWAGDDWHADTPAMRSGSVADLLNFVRQEQGTPSPSSSASAYMQAIRELKPFSDLPSLEKASSGPWQEMVSVSTWLTQNEAVFPRFADASRKPHAHIQLAPSNDRSLPAEMRDALFVVTVPGLGAFDLVAQGLLATGWSKWEDDGGEALVEAAIDVMRIGMSLEREYPMIARREAIKIIERGQAALRRALVISDAKAQFVRRVQAKLEELDSPMRALTASYNFERLAVLDALQRVFSPSSGGSAEQVWSLVGDNARTPWSSIESEVMEIGFERSMEEVTAYFDALSDWASLPVSKMLAEEPAIVSRSQQLQNPITRYMVQGITAPQHAMLRAETVRRGFFVVFEIYAEWGKTGSFVDSLDNLSGGEELRDMRIDPHTGADLIYVRTRDGFLLYSVGPDLKDDGGRPYLPGTEMGDVIVWPMR